MIDERVRVVTSPRVSIYMTDIFPLWAKDKRLEHGGRAWEACAYVKSLEVICHRGLHQ